jgi:Predicted hydrolases or acyltransferases (alpha/beta hydrolase superfamily)
MARPGYGESSPYELKSVGEWGDIAALLADELGIERFDVFGSSSGAPYAYAIAARSPKRVRNVFVFSGTPALCDTSIDPLWPFPLNRSATIDWARAVAREVFFPGVDPANLSSDEPWSTDLRDSMAHDCFGPALDLKIRCLDWGFRLNDVAQRVYMQHSRDDESVPFASAEATERLLPNCELEVRAGGGHYSPELLDSFVERTMLPALLREGGR